MSVYTESKSVTLESVDCCDCGTRFAVDKAVLDAKRETGGDFHCPNGHTLTYGLTELKRLRDQVAKKTAEIDQAKADAKWWQGRNSETAAALETTERRVRAQRGVVTRMKRRITKGRCVCCSREFKDLQKHMKESHPKWNPDRHAAAIEGKA